MLQDILWAIILCTSTCDVELWIGSRSQLYSNLPYGVSKIKMDLNESDEGPIGIRLYKALVVSDPLNEPEPTENLSSLKLQVVEGSTHGQFEYSQFTELCKIQLPSILNCVLISSFTR